MERTRFRHPAVIVFAFAVALSGLASCAAAASYDDTYFVRQEIGPANGDPLIVQKMLLPVTLQSDDNGSRLNARTVWFDLYAGPSQHGDSYDLDAGSPDDVALAAFLTSGIETRLDDKGQVVSVGAADPQALETLARRQPRARDLLARLGDAVGVRPFVLPQRLHVGQHLHEKQQVEGVGELAWTMRVVAVDDQQVELEMQATSSDGASLSGHQMLRRDSGMPVNAWLTMSLPDGLVPGQSEPMQLRMLAISQRHALTMGASTWNGDAWKDFREDFAKRLASPEFRGEAVPADKLQDLDFHLKRQEIGRRSPAEWERIRNGLIFVMDGRGHPRPQIQLAGQYDTVASGQWPQPFLMHLKGARLLDANGKPLAGITPVPNRLFELTTTDAQLGLTESDEEFPFRLPPALPAAELDGLAAIALELELEEYVLQQRDVIAYGKQAGSSSLTLDWSRHWVELEQAAEGRDVQDAWVIAPLDAQGRPLRHDAIPYNDRLLQPLSQSLLPPVFSSSSSHHYRVITAEPIAAVELRRYRLQQRPTVWTFNNGADMLAGGALIGVRHTSESTELGVPATAVSGQALLKAFDTPVVDKSGDYVRVRLRGDLQDVAARFCKMAPLSAENVKSSWEPRSRGDLYGSDDPEWVGWSMFRFADEQPTVAQASCPQWVEPVVERLGKGGCFQSLDNGYVGIAAACKVDVANARKQQTLAARDADGQRLAELPGGTEGVSEDRLRFWGPVDTIEYLRVDASTVSRDLPLPVH